MRKAIQCIGSPARCFVFALLLGLSSAAISPAQSGFRGDAASGCTGTWTVVPSPNGPSSNSHLYGVSASAFDNIWAVGSYQLPNFGQFRTLTEVWNGSAWSVVPSADR